MAVDVWTPAQVRGAICQIVETATNLPCVTYRDNPPVPGFLIRRTSAQPRTAYSRKTPMFQFTLTALAPRADMAAGQDWLDRFVSRGDDLSVWDALEADKTLGATCHTSIVGEWGADSQFQFGEISYLGAELTIDVHPLPVT